MNVNKKVINSLYELKTPIGYLGMGYDKRSIPLIIEYINSIEFKFNFNTIRFSSLGSYTKLKNSSDFYSVFSRFNTDNNVEFNQKLYSHLSEYDINTSFNFFSIMSSHDESFNEYIVNNNISNFFLDDTLSFIKNNPKIKILFIDDKESYFYDRNFFDSFYNFYKDNNLSKYQIVFITNTMNIDYMYTQYISYNRLDSFMNVRSIPFLIYPVVGECMYQYYTYILPNNQEYISDAGQSYSLPMLDELDSKRSKYYLSLNRNSSRLHRPQLILNLIKSNLFEKGLVSLLHSDEFDEFCENPINNEYKTHIGDKYPFVVDVEDAEIVSSMHNFFTKKDMWLDAYFSIVSETSVDNTFTFITEKTIRPMIYYHPFIVWGNPNTLSYLRNLGFETFPEFFDESYDLILDNSKRLGVILENIKRLCELDISEIHLMYQSVKPKLLHNHNLLMELFKSNKIFNELINF